MAAKQRPWIESSLPVLGMASAVIALAINQIISKMAMSKGTSFYILSVYSNGLATLVLFPTAFLLHRSKRPPLSFPVLWRIFLLASFGCSAEVGSYAGISYSSPTLSTAMLILVPAFTYILAIIFSYTLYSFLHDPHWLELFVTVWKEEVDLRRFSTIAKSFGTLVSISGAFIVTLYKGPAILNAPSTSISITQLYLPSTQNWILGGLLLACASFMTASWCILQASILNMYPAEMIIVAFYCFFVTVQSSLVTLIAERDLAALKIETKVGLMAVFYAFAWCIGVDCRFYAVMWGKAKEWEINVGIESSNYQAPLLQDNIQQV